MEEENIKVHGHDTNFQKKDISTRLFNWWIQGYKGNLLLHLYYSSFKKTNKKSESWYSELELSLGEMNFLKKLLGLDDIYKSIYDVEKDFLELEIVQL